MSYMTLDLFDDHADGRKLTAQVIGYVLRPDRLPVVVGCPAKGIAHRGHVSLNEVVDDYSLAAKDASRAGPHLTRRSCLVVSPEQLQTLHATGALRYDESTVVCLFPSAGGAS